MNIWVLTAWDNGGDRMNEVMSLLFASDLVMPKVMELFDEDPQIVTVRVETCYREEGTDDASYYDYNVYNREDMVG